MTTPVRIPADVELPDRVLGPFTARQLLILAATAAALFGLWQALRGLIAVPVFLAAATPVLALVAAVVLGRRDGMALDRLLLAALHHHTTATHRIAAPEGDGPVPAWLAATATHTDRRERRTRAWQAPARGVSEAGRDLGVVDLGGHGLAVIALASTVNFALQSPTEQEALVAGFGRYLHSLTAPVQVLIHAQRVDLTGQITQLHAAADGLPDPGLAHLAHEHAQFLTQLAAQTELLCRQVLLVWCEPTAPDHHTANRGRRGWRRRRRELGAAPRRAAEDRLLRRIGEAADLLAPLGVTVTPLDPDQTAAILTATTNPGLPHPTTAALTGPDPTAGDDTGWPPHHEPGRGRVDGLDDAAIEALNHHSDGRPGWVGGRR